MRDHLSLLSLCCFSDRQTEVETETRRQGKEHSRRTAKTEQLEYFLGRQNKRRPISSKFRLPRRFLMLQRRVEITCMADMRAQFTDWESRDRCSSSTPHYV
jgi:hypothetical protein